MITARISNTLQWLRIRPIIGLDRQTPEIASEKTGEQTTGRPENGMTRKTKIGLALGSGGARGLAHAGVLAALEEAGLKPDFIAGTSMGAIVGSVYAERPDSVRAWERLSAFACDPDFLATWEPYIAKGSGDEENGGRLHGMLDSLKKKLIAIKTATRPSLVEAEALRRPLAATLKSRSFEELEIPFAAVAVDLLSGERVVFREGNLLDGVYASSAIPAVFPPLQTGGRLICDGGAPFRVPVETCREMGADFVIAVDIPAFKNDKAEFKTGIDLILRSDTIARLRLNRFVMAGADLVIEPAVGSFHWADFRAADSCRAAGYAAAQKMIPELRKAIADRESPLARIKRWFGRGNRPGRFDQ